MGRKRKDDVKQQLKKAKKEERRRLYDLYLKGFTDITESTFLEVIDEMVKVNAMFNEMSKEFLEAHDKMLKICRVKDFSETLDLIEEMLEKDRDTFINKKIDMSMGMDADENSIFIPTRMVLKVVNKGFDRIRDYADEVRDLIEEEHCDYVMNMLIKKVEDDFHRIKVDLLENMYNGNEHHINYLEIRNLFLKDAMKLDKELNSDDEEAMLFEEAEEELEDEIPAYREVKLNNRVRCTYKELHKFLESKGFEQARQNSTTHIVFRNAEGVSLPVPNKPKNCPQGTMHSILKQSGFTKKDLNTFLQGA